MAKKLILIVLAGIVLLAVADNTFAFGGGHRGGGHYGGGHYGGGHYGGGHYGGGHYGGGYYGGRYYNHPRVIIVPPRRGPIIIFPSCGIILGPTIVIGF